MRANLRLLLVTLLLVTSSGEAQTTAPLTFEKPIPVAVQHALGLVNPVKCGSVGQIQIRFDPADNSVSSISADGRKTWWASTRQIPDLLNSKVVRAGVTDFAPADDGGVYLLMYRVFANWTHDEAVARFDGDGVFVSLIPLDETFDPNFDGKTLAVFPNSNFLLAGFDRPSSKPVTALFGADGQFLKVVILPGETHPVSKGQQGPNANDPTGVPREIELSTAESGDDGNVYLTRAAPQGPVYVISPAGTARKIDLHPPDDEAKLLEAKGSAGVIAAFYYYPSSSKRHELRSIMLVDARDGDVRRTLQYIPDYHETGIGVVCYQNNTFTFLSVDSAGFLQLVRAH